MRDLLTCIGTTAVLYFVQWVIGPGAALMLALMALSFCIGAFWAAGEGAVIDCTLDIPEDPLEEEPLFFVEPKDKLPGDEFSRQRTALAMIARLAPQAFVMAIPNGSKASDWERVRKWREGMVCGAPDLAIYWNHGVLFAEMKSGDGKVKPAQIWTMNRLHRLGFRCGVYRRAETLIAHLAESGCPVREVLG